MRRWARIFDSAFRIPGTEITFGIDPILGLFPGIGDLAMQPGHEVSQRHRRHHQTAISSVAGRGRSTTAGARLGCAGAAAAGGRDRDGTQGGGKAEGPM